MAALPQIESLNPLVKVTAIPTLDPFVGSVDRPGDEAAMVDFLQREKVDVVVACDLTHKQMVSGREGSHTDRQEMIDSAAHTAGSMFYGAGTYGFYGYVFADLGPAHEFTFGNLAHATAKKTLKFKPMAQAFEPTNWSLSHDKTAEGGSPFGGYKRALKARQFAPQLAVPILGEFLPKECRADGPALWEYEKRHGGLPAGGEDQKEELTAINAELQTALGVHAKLLDASTDVVK